MGEENKVEPGQCNGSRNIIQRLREKEISQMVDEILCFLLLSSSLYALLVCIFRNLALPKHSTIHFKNESLPSIINHNITKLSNTDQSQNFDGSIYALFMLIVSCYVFGYFSKFLNLPPLLGMILTGLLLGNVPYIDVATQLNKYVSSVLRKAAFSVILIQGGLGLNTESLQKLKGVCVRLAFTPCLIETLSAMIFAHLILGFPWVYGIMLGFVLGAVSPAICVPAMLELKKLGYGIDQGIPTLVIAASSIDDVLAITGFSVTIGIAFSNSDWWHVLLITPLEILAGIIYGIITGLVLTILPGKSNCHRPLYMFSLVFVFGLLSLFGSSYIGIDAAGALGCLIMAVTVNFTRFSKENEEAVGINSCFDVLWLLFEPVLFGLIGAEVDLRGSIKPEAVGFGLLVLIVGLVLRTIAAFLSVLGSGMNLHERLFVAMAWLPKATVQILTIAVLGIVITAPLGAVLMKFTGPKLLQKTQSIEDIELMDPSAVQENIN